MNEAENCAFAGEMSSAGRSARVYQLYPRRAEIAPLQAEKINPVADPAACQSESFAAEDRPHVRKDAAGRIATVAARYDIRAISPQEVDRLVEDLWCAGYEVEEDLFDLSCRGAKYLSCFYGDAYPAEKLEQKTDLLATHLWKIDYNLSRGNNRAGFMKQIAFLETLQELGMQTRAARLGDEVADLA